MSGRLITIEGIDGAGKSTLAAALSDALSLPQHGGRDVLALREPGGVVLSERIRTLVKDPALNVSPAAEALLYAAARAQLVTEQIMPALACGRWVLLDRFTDSSLAYQGVARKLGIDPVRAVNAFATGGLSPDRTILMRIDPALARHRQQGRDEQADRLEREGDDFFAAVALAYDELAEAESERFAVVDATLPPDDVLEAALQALMPLLQSRSQ
jgi:dTMP kinase